MFDVGVTINVDSNKNLNLVYSFNPLNSPLASLTS